MNTNTVPLRENTEQALYLCPLDESVSERNVQRLGGILCLNKHLLCSLQMICYI